MCGDGAEGGVRVGCGGGCWVKHQCRRPGHLGASTRGCMRAGREKGAEEYKCVPSRRPVFALGR